MKKDFEWDERKDAINKKKHGVSFEDATMVFFDPNLVEAYSENHSFFEERWKVIGLSGLALLAVFFTERHGSVRIISARKADKIEEEEYFYGYGTFNSR